MESGLLLLPLAVAVLICAPLSGRLVARYGPRPSLCLAGAGTALGAAMLLTLSATTPLPLLLVAFGVFGIGAGMVNAPITTTAVSGMPADRSGVAAATATTSRQVGQSVGVAVAGTLLAGAAVGPGFGSATAPVWWMCAGIGVAVLLIGWRTSVRSAP